MTTPFAAAHESADGTEPTIRDVCSSVAIQSKADDICSL
jgi:hypothetical protein